MNYSSLSITEWMRGAKQGTAGATVTGHKVVGLNLEFDRDVDEQRDEFFVPLDPTASLSGLIVKTCVHAPQRHTKIGSAAYLAALRRREADTLSKTVRNLTAHAREEHFVAWTHEALESLRRAVQKLSDVEESAYQEHEGNACEILREVRDSFMNGGWQEYSNPDVANAVADILRKLAVADEVSAEDVETAMDTLLDLGLEPGAGLACFNEEEQVLD